jgi:1,4-alpha-glucan branching enzyme
VRYSFVDTHGVLLAVPPPEFGVFAPLTAESGVEFLGRDVESSQQVWSADHGYPGDVDYREFHRDLGFEGELDYLRPHLDASGRRRHLGFKYYRITGEAPDGVKEPYNPSAAARKAAMHAEHFVRQRVDQVRRVSAATGRDPIIVSPYDAELFGHWWLEGLAFLEEVIRLAAKEDSIECSTPSRYLDGQGEEGCSRGQPVESTWGDGGYCEVWVNGTNDWLYPRLRKAESAMVRMARTHPAAGGLLCRALNQCARHLMLAQSSDWAFLMSARTAGEYPRRRFSDQISRFNTLAGQVQRGVISPTDLERCEWLDDPFPEMDYRLFAGQERGRASD